MGRRRRGESLPALLFGKPLVAISKMRKGFAVTTDDGGVGAFGKGELPGVVFTKAFTGFSRATLKFGTFPGMLETDGLWDVARDEGQALRFVVEAFQDFGDRDARHEQRAIRQGAVAAQPLHGWAGSAGVDLAFEVDQER